MGAGLENGIRLAGETGAKIEVVQLVAILHDSQRVNEFIDPITVPLPRLSSSGWYVPRGPPLDLPDDEFGLLHRACEPGPRRRRSRPSVKPVTVPVLLGHPLRDRPEYSGMSGSGSPSGGPPRANSLLPGSESTGRTALSGPTRVRDRVGA